MAIQHLPLNKLVASPANVRKTDRKADVEALAASIQAHGLLQNLSVQARDDGRYEVVAGARRHAALKLLAKAGKIARDLPVPCNLVDAGDASEASLAENVHRVAMNAMDEADAFAAMIEEGLAVDAIAARFGATMRHVEQRLALASLSAKIKAAYRRGEINLEAARAFAIEPDHAKQDAVLRALGKPIAHAGQVRALLMQGAMKASDRIARFVGLEAYEAAGGALTRDLFDPDTVFIADPALMTRLGQERLDAICEELRAQGWGWVDAELGAAGAFAGHSGQRIHPTRRPMTRGERKALAAIEAEIEAVEARLADPDVEDDALWSEQDALEARRSALIAQTELWDEELIAHAGVLVRLDHEGRPLFTHGVVAKADQAALKRVLAARAPEGEAPRHERQHGEAAASRSRLPKALARELTVARAVALRSEISNAPEIGLALAVYAAAQGALRARRAQGVELSAHCVAVADDPNFEDARARLGAQLPEDDAALLDWCLAQDRERLLAALAVLIAGALDLAHEDHGPRDRALQRLADRLAAATNLDMRRRWKVDAAFLSRLPKAMLMTIAAEAPALASPPTQREAALRAWAKLKREDLAEALAKALGDCDWLPELLITPAPRAVLPAATQGDGAAHAVAAP